MRVATHLVRWTAAFSLAVATLSVLAVPMRADGEPRSTYLMAGRAFAPSITSTPAIDSDGVLYVSVSFETANPAGRIVALVPGADGKLTEKWRQDINDDISASPMIAPDGTIYVGANNGVFYALDKATGARKWEYDTNQLVPGLAYIRSTAALSPDGKTVYVGIGSLFSVVGGLCAFSVDRHDLQWVRPVEDAVESSPAVAADGTIYFGSWDDHLYAVAPDSTVKWRQALDGSIFGSPAIGGDGTIYIGTAVNQFVAFTPAGTVKWQRAMTVGGSAAVGADGTVFVANYADGSLYALNWQTGDTLWKSPIGSSIGPAPAVRADNTVIFGGNDNEHDQAKVIAYDGFTGAVKWSANVGGDLSGSVVVSPAADHTVYIGSSDGYLYAFAGNEYGLSRYASWPAFQHDPAHTGRAPEIFVGGRLRNLATRGSAGPDRSLITGFVIMGSASKNLLIRAVGPTLRTFDVQGAMADPGLSVIYNQDFRPFVNDDWGTNDNATLLKSMFAAVGAFDLPMGSKDAAVLGPLAGAKAYTATVDSPTGTSGVALAEIYDADPLTADAYLANLSSRGFVGTGEEVLIPSLVVGPGRIRVLLRAVGPGLARFDVTGVLQRPSVTVFRGSTPIASNTGWTTDGWKGDLAVAARSVGAFALADNSTDSAMILSLSEGVYTFQVSGVGGTTGVALVEVYALPF